MSNSQRLMLLLALACLVLPLRAVERASAVDQALKWLRMQTQDTGPLVAEGKHQIALTALILLAHASAGIGPMDETSGPLIQRGLWNIIAAANDQGYFAAKDQSRMYGHALAVLACCSGIGAGGPADLDQALLAALGPAIAYILGSAAIQRQGDALGGWHYEANGAGADLSVTGWQLQALNSARDIGLVVPDDVLRAGLGFVERMIQPNGQVGYDARGGDRPSLRGVALLALAHADRERPRLIDAVAERLVGEEPAWRGPWFFYRCAHEALGLWRARPDRWASYGPALQELLIQHQHAEGWWPAPPGDNESQFTRIYSTAMAVLALTADWDLLPGR